MNLTHALKATERSLIWTAMRARVRVGAALWPQRTAEAVAQRFFRTERPAPARLDFSVSPRIGRMVVPDGTITTYRWDAAAAAGRSAPLVLLVHGWNGWAQQLEAFVAPLQARGFAVLAFDHVAHGRSDGVQTSLPAMMRSLESLLAQEPAVRAAVAHSLGAAATAAVLASAERQLDAAVLVAPPSDPRPYLRALALALAAPHSLLPAIQRAAERHAGVAFEHLVADPLRVRRIRTPLLIVHDVTDNDVPITEGHAYAAAAQARLLVSDGLGHRRVLRDAHVVQESVDFVAGRRERGVAGAKDGAAIAGDGPATAVADAVIGSTAPRAVLPRQSAALQSAAADASCCAR